MGPVASSTDRYPIVPMPSWSVYVGCTRLLLSIIILVFSSICIKIWAAHPAFILTLITSLMTLLILVYYTLSLNYATHLYNRIVILTLEFTGTIMWAASSILLAIWVNRHLTFEWLYDIAMDNGGKAYLQELPKELTLAKVASDHIKKFANGKYSATLKVAGVSTGLAALQFVLFCTTLGVFANNLRKNIGENYPCEGGGGTTAMKHRMASVAGDRMVIPAEKGADDGPGQNWETGRVTATKDSNGEVDGGGKLKVISEIWQLLSSDS